MKHLILLRHAKSSWKDQSLTDHDRPLNTRGKSTAPIMGQRLATKDIKPQLIISSTANRAFKTACIVAKEIKYEVKNIKTNRNLFHAWPEEMIKIVSECDDSWDKIMLVGHNPGMTMFANLLLKSNKFDNIPTAGLATFSLDIKNWKQILKHQLIQCELIDYDYPKLNN